MQLQNPQKKSRPFQVCLHSFHICFHMCPSRTKLFPSHFHKKLLLACERTNKHEERYYFAWHNIVSGDLTKWTFLFFLEPLCLVFFKKNQKRDFFPTPHITRAKSSSLFVFVLSCFGSLRFPFFAAITTTTGPPYQPTAPLLTLRFPVQFV